MYNTNIPAGADTQDAPWNAPDEFFCNYCDAEAIEAKYEQIEMEVYGDIDSTELEGEEKAHKERTIKARKDEFDRECTGLCQQCSDEAESDYRD